MILLSPYGSQISTTPVVGTGKVLLDVSAMIVHLEFILLLRRSTMGSRLAARDNKDGRRYFIVCFCP